MDIFGKQRLADFYLDPTYININHGSFGSCPKVVMDVKIDLQKRVDFNAQKWFRTQAQIQINKVRQYVANIISCSSNNLFLVQNATDGYNSLLKSLQWQQGDVILVSNTAYFCVKKTTQWIKERYKIQVLEVNFKVQDLQTPQKFLMKIRETVNSFGKKIKLAVFDHIMSNPGYVCPVQQMSVYFKEKDIPLIIDGAHAMGQQDINIEKFNVHAYFSNFHKWAYAPKSSAFLYISDKFLNIVRPVITGNFKGQGPDRQFFWTGTRDYTSYLAIPKGIQYNDSFGKDAVKNYNKKLSLKAGEQMVKIWKTELLTEDVRCISYMNNIRAPTDDLELCQKIREQMFQNHNCYPVFFPLDGKVFCRISCQIYNELSDYQYAANKFLQLLNEKKK